MTEAQALLHGDLHTGSIFVNELGMKIFDSICILRHDGI